MPGLRAEGRLAQAGLHPEVQRGPRHVGLMVIEGILLRRIAEQFETVFSVIPVQGRRELKPPFPLRLDGNERFQRMLELVVVGGAVEGAGPEILVADAGLPTEVPAAEILRPVPKGFERAEIAVQPAGGIAAESVAALVAGRDAVEAAPMPDIGRGRGSEGAEGAAFQAGSHSLIGILARDDIDSAQQRRCTIHPCRRALKHFDAFDVAEVHRKVEGVVPRLRISDVDAIQEDGDLVAGAAADADVGLHPHRAPLTHIHAQGVFEQVVDRLGRGRCDRHAVQERDDPGAAVQGHGNARGRNGHAVNGFRPGLRERRYPQQAGYDKSNCFLHFSNQSYEKTHDLPKKTCRLRLA